MPSVAVFAYLNLSSAGRSLMALGAIAVVVLSLVVGLVGNFGTGPVSILTVTFGLLLLISQNYVLVGPLKSVGNPAILAGLACLALWAAARVLGVLIPRRDHPTRWSLLVFVLASTIAWASGFMRPLTASESSGATRALFPIIAASGVVLLCADGLRRRDDVERLSTASSCWVGWRPSSESWSSSSPGSTGSTPLGCQGSRRTHW